MHPAQGIVVLWTLSNLKILEKLTSVQIGVLFGAFSSEVVVNCPVFYVQPHSCAHFARIVQFYNSVYGLVCRFIFTMTDYCPTAMQVG
jgi:hypothetical protein